MHVQSRSRLNPQGPGRVTACPRGSTRGQSLEVKVLPSAVCPRERLEHMSPTAGLLASELFLV